MKSNKNIGKNKILLIGHYCATGGISIHLRRLKEHLEGSFHFSVIDESRLEDTDGTYFNIRNKNLFAYLKLIRQTDIVHIHSTSFTLRLLHLVVAKLLLKKPIITIHSLTLTKTKFDRFKLKTILKLASKIVLVSEEIKTKLNIKKALVMNAFIPPILENEKALPEEINLLLAENEAKQIVVSNAYRLNLHNGKDLYGLDLLIEVAQKAKKNQDALFILFILTTLEMNKDVFVQYAEKIKKEDLSNYIHIHTSPISFVQLIMQSDCVVRATNTDGDALTVREALFLNKLCIASDAVPRPTNTILFENRNSTDLYEKIVNNIGFTDKTVNTDNTNILSFYKSLYS